MAMVDKLKIGKTQAILTGSFIFGLLIVIFFKLFPNTYATFLSLAMITPFLMLILGSTKHFLWAVLIMLLPITVDITIGHTEHLSGAAGYVISAFDIVLVCLYLLWFVEMFRKKDVRINFFPRISVPAFFLIGMATLSMVFAPFPILSMFEIIEVIKMYFCFLYLANNIKDKSDVQFIVAFLLLGLLLEGVLGFAQHRYGEPFWPTALGGPHWINSRVKGSWVSSNDFAWYITSILPLTFSLLFFRMKFVYKFICFLTLCLGGGSLLWTNSRGGWLSFAVAICFIIPFIFPKIKSKAALIKTFVSIVAIGILISPLYPRLFAKFDTRFTSDDKGAAESRLPQYEVAFNIIKNNPLLGVGINNYTEVMHQYDITEEGLESITPHAVHNIFLHIAAEMGIFGLAIFIWFLAVIFFKGLKTTMSTESFIAYSVVGMLAGILAFLVHGLVDTASIGSKLFMFLWFFSGIIIGAERIKQER